jgi:hypothetical protein
MNGGMLRVAMLLLALDLPLYIQSTSTVFRVELWYVSLLYCHEMDVVAVRPKVLMDEGDICLHEYTIVGLFLLHLMIGWMSLGSWVSALEAA